MPPNQVILLWKNWAKIPWRSKGKKCLMPIEGIKMSPIHSCCSYPPFISSSSYSSPCPSVLTDSHSKIWDSGQVPPRTLGLINHPRFNICPVPKGCPLKPPPPPLVKMGPRLYSSVNIPPYSSTNTSPLESNKTSIVPCPSEEETLFSPLWQKPSEAKMGTASRDAWDPAGVPPLLQLLLCLLGHPSLAHALFFCF